MSDNNVNLNKLASIDNNGPSSMSLLVSSLMQYNVFLLVVFTFMAENIKTNSCVTTSYILVAIISLLLPLLATINLHRELRKQADEEIRELYKINPSLFKDQSNKFKAKYSDENKSNIRINFFQYHIQNISILFSIFHTLVVVLIIYVWI